jgi:Histidine kinase-, DNA gyrase B-, and HSP90-like ATPase
MKFSTTTSRSWRGHGVEAPARAMTPRRSICAHPDERRHGEPDLSEVSAAGFATNAAAYTPGPFNQPITVAPVGTKVRPDRIGSADGQFQQAETADGRSQFLQIVTKPDQVNRKKRKEKQQLKLTRVAFRVSRLMEFCTRRELQNQTGHCVEEWPLVVLKELMDNALDACEEAEVAPVISVTVEPDSVTIQDNGGGIKPETVKSILDYTIRVSSREAYVSPTRGAQGNALKTILAMGYVLDRERQDGHNTEAAGVTIIETSGVKHCIEFRVDHINNEPKISHTTTSSPIDVGTTITVKWPLIWEGVSLLEFARNEFMRLGNPMCGSTRI